ncbi:hypothetical protein F4777DRAFT_139742 [Nemania sp. FL0916]|nr:hypothetical protein F4777DRAFT_139742 [Nemania sp. FL0916]
MMLDRAVNVNVQSEGYGWAFQTASKHGHIEIVRMLRDKGADDNVHGKDVPKVEGHKEVDRQDKDQDIRYLRGRSGLELMGDATSHTAVTESAESAREAHEEEQETETRPYDLKPLKGKEAERYVSEWSGSEIGSD